MAPIVIAFALVPVTLVRAVQDAVWTAAAMQLARTPKRPMPPASTSRACATPECCCRECWPDRRRLSLDRPVVALYAQHDVRPRLHRPGGADLRQVAAGADDAGVSAFGFTEAVTIQMQGVVKLPSGEDIPVQFIQMVPYVLTIIVLAGFIGSSRPPRALGIPYEKER